MFTDRLAEYRTELELNKRQMSRKLNIKDAYYNMIESGKRPPSKKVLNALVALSGKPEEYWVYGIEYDTTYINTREDFKCTKIAIDQLLNLNLDIKNLFKESKNEDIIIKKGSIEELIIAALKADLEHLYLKKNQKEQ